MPLDWQLHTGWTITDTVILTGGLAVAWKIWSSSRSIKPLSLPPGSKGLPILGNILDIPTKQEWFTYTDWGKKYGMRSSTLYLCLRLIVSVIGPISYAEAIGFPIILLNTYDIGCELLDRRSSMYSSRRASHMMNERYHQVLKLNHFIFRVSL